MFTSLANKTVNTLYKNSLLSKDEIELYEYGFYVLFSYLFYLLLSLLLGVLFRLLLEGILFFIFFSVIRSYAGGVHASKEILCTLYTSLSFLICVIATDFFITVSNPIVGFLLLILSAISILCFAPLDTPEKPLSKIERISYRKKSCLILCLIILLAIASLSTRNHNIFYVCATSLGLEGVLLFLGHIKCKLRCQ